ncbi:MAG TPA: anti-sigma F factor [Firmicutes bacterium]|nr:anti-sigma F factor [Bacillota bacterium]
MVTNSMELRFKATLKNESLARTAVISFIESLHPTAEIVGELKTIVSEAVSNAIIHGYHLDASKDVYVKGDIEDDVLSLIISDYGQGIKDIDLALTPHYTTRPDLERAGMGLTIIESLSDSFKIRSVINMGTRVMVTKKIVSAEEKVTDDVGQ